MTRAAPHRSRVRAVAIASGGILAVLLTLAVAEPDPTRAHTRALLKLRAGRELTVLIAGGSISPLVGRDHSDNKIPYAGFLCHLQRLYPQASLSVVRGLWDDSTARDLRDRIKPLLKMLRPDITILCLGSADYLARTRPADYDAACRRLVSIVRRRGGFVIVAGAVLPEVKTAAPISALTRRNAVDAGCTYVDLNAVLRASRAPIGLLLLNEQHLTARGAAMLANALITAWRHPFFIPETAGDAPPSLIRLLPPPGKGHNAGEPSPTHIFTSPPPHRTPL